MVVVIVLTHAVAADRTIHHHVKCLDIVKGGKNLKYFELYENERWLEGDTVSYNLVSLHYGNIKHWEQVCPD